MNKLLLICGGIILLSIHTIKADTMVAVDTSTVRVSFDPVAPPPKTFTAPQLRARKQGYLDYKKNLLKEKQGIQDRIDALTILISSAQMQIDQARALGIQ